jgi:hypothetical protein
LKFQRERIQQYFPILEKNNNVKVLINGHNLKTHKPVEIPSLLTTPKFYLRKEIQLRPFDIGSTWPLYHFQPGPLPKNCILSKDHFEKDAKFIAIQIP